MRFVNFFNIFTKENKFLSFVKEKITSGFSVKFLNISKSPLTVWEPSKITLPMLSNLQGGNFGKKLLYFLPIKW